jgi:hypothetical protein
MRVVQAAALPGSGPSCLAEVLLSGVMHVDRPLAGFDVYTFAPELRPLLRMVVPADDARRTVDAVSDFITPRLGRSGDFPAVIASATGTLSLPAGGTPFAEVPHPAPDPAPGPNLAPAPAPGPGTLAAPDIAPARGMSPHPSAEYVVTLRDVGTGAERAGYLVASNLVLTADTDYDADGRHVTVLTGHDPARLRAHEAQLLCRVGAAELYRVTVSSGPPLAAPAVRWGHVGAVNAVTSVTVARLADPVGDRPYQGTVETATVLSFHDRSAPDTGDPVRRSLRTSGRPAEPGEFMAIFDQDVLIGLLTFPAATVQVVTAAMLSPVSVFLQDPDFMAAAGAPVLDADRPGTHVPLDLPARPVQAPPATAGPQTTGGWSVPPRPGFLTFEQDYALARLEQLIHSEPGIGTVVVQGLADSPVKVAAEYVHRNRLSLQRAVWLDVRELPAFIDSPDYVRLRRSAPDTSFTRWLVVLDGRAAEVTGPEKQRVLDELTGIGARIVLLDGPYGNLPHRSIRVEQGLEWNQTDVTGPHPLREEGPPSATVRAATAQVLSVLPWLDSPVGFEVLGAMWAPNLLTDVFREPAVEGAFRIDWRRRRIHLADGPRVIARESRDLAVRLLTAYAEGGDGRPVPDEDELTRHVLALSQAVAPADVTGPTARLFTRSAFHLLAHGRGAVGVQLGERACEAASDGSSEQEGLRVQLAAAAITSGLEGFVALSPASLTAYAHADGAAGRDEELEWAHGLMASARRSVSEDLPMTVLDMDGVLAWCRHRFGPGRLSNDLAKMIEVLADRGPGQS